MAAAAVFLGAMRQPPRVTNLIVHRNSYIAWWTIAPSFVPSKPFSTRDNFDRVHAPPAPTQQIVPADTAIKEVLAAVQAELLQTVEVSSRDTKHNITVNNNDTDNDTSVQPASFTQQPRMLLSRLGRCPQIQKALQALPNPKLLKILQESSGFELYGGGLGFGGGQVWVTLSQSDANSEVLSLCKEIASNANSNIETTTATTQASPQCKSSTKTVVIEPSIFSTQSNETIPPTPSAEATCSVRSSGIEQMTLHEAMHVADMVARLRNFFGTGPSSLRHALAVHLQGTSNDTAHANALMPPPPPPPPPPPTVPPPPPLPAEWLEAINHAITAFDQVVQPTEVRLTTRAQLLQNLRTLLAPLGGVLHVFGSCATKLHTDTSDLDVTWVLPYQGDEPDDMRRWSMKHLCKLQASISGNDFDDTDVELCARKGIDSIPEKLPGVKCSRLLPGSKKVPTVLRLENANGQTLCDITMNNWEGLRNSTLLCVLGNLCPSFRILGRIVKHWARSRGIADRPRGRLSTYGLMLMLASTLQQQGSLVEPPTIKALCDRLVTIGDDATALERAATTTDGTSWAVATIRHQPHAGPEVASNLGELLIRFFESYCKRHSGLSQGHTVNLCDGSLLQEVQCPLTGVNIEAQLSRRHWQGIIFPEFMRAVKMLHFPERSQAMVDGSLKSTARINLERLSQSRWKTKSRAVVPPPPPTPPPPLGSPPVPPLTQIPVSNALQQRPAPPLL